MQLLYVGLTIVEIVKAAGVGWDYGLPTSLFLLLHLPYVYLLLALAMLVWSVLAWQKRFWSGFSRSYYSVVAVADVVFLIRV